MVILVDRKKRNPPQIILLGFSFKSLTQKDVGKFSDLFVHRLNDIDARKMTDFCFDYDFYSFVFVFLDSPEAEINFSSTTQSFMGAILGSRDRFVHEVGGSILDYLASEVDVIDFVPIFVDIDLVKETSVFFWELTNQRDVAKTFFP